MKTTADMPPQIASEYKKAPRAQAAAEATGDGYTTTRPMKKAAVSKGQFGLPPSVKSSKGMKTVKM
jgi:hypothetical protein